MLMLLLVGSDDKGVRDADDVRLTGSEVSGEGAGGGEGGLA